MVRECLCPQTLKETLKSEFQTVVPGQNYYMHASAFSLLRKEACCVNLPGLGQEREQRKKNVPEFLQIMPCVHFRPYWFSYLFFCVTIINLFHEYTYMLNPMCPPSKVPNRRVVLRLSTQASTCNAEKSMIPNRISRKKLYLSTSS